ncbi:MAG: hypothetical protein LBS05_10265 [Tannerellaceae bacterium]|nr:hypothetical protein [Tannerellaceae bacterium]
MTAIEQKINEGYFVQSIEDKPGPDGTPGFEITLIRGNETPLKWWIYGGKDGAPGASGAPGRAGTQWSIGSSGTWVSVDADGTTTDTHIPAVGDKAPVPKNGKWVFFEWDPNTNSYDSVPTSYVADTLSTHLIDNGSYYVLYVPMQEKTPEGQLVYNADGTEHWILAEITLPKWAQAIEGPVYFKILGYAEISADTARLLDDGTVDLYWEYWHINLHHPAEGPAFSPDDEKWKWKWVDTLFADMKTDKYSIPSLYEKEIAVVFSLNRPQSYMDTVKIGLYDSQDKKLGIIALDQAQPLSQILTKTKVSSGSNSDTLYYARLRTETAALILPIQVQKNRVYYRLVAENNDNLRSELSASTIGLNRQTIPSELNVFNVDHSGPIPGPPDTFLIQARDTIPISIVSPEKIYDYYIDSLRGGGHLPYVAFGDSTEGYYNYKTFTVDSPKTLTDPPYLFRLGVYKLQKDGAVYIDTILIKSVF